MIREQLAQKEIDVGYGQRPAATVAQRSRIGTRAVRSDTQLDAIEPANGTAARGHRLDRQHRSDDAHAGFLRLILQLESTIEARHVGACAAHVEADRLLKTR